jgi:hypothetical protein
LFDDERNKIMTDRAMLVAARWRVVELVFERGDCDPMCPHLRQALQRHDEGPGEAMCECSILESIEGDPFQCPMFTEPEGVK